MVAKVPEKVFKQVQMILDKTELKYRILKVKDEKDFLGLEMNFKGEENTLELLLYISSNPFRMNLFIPDIVPMSSEIRDNELEIIKIINDLNAEKILYGNLGYSTDLDQIVYSNSISLAGRSSIEEDELMDYIVYSTFISKKANDEITNYLQIDKLISPRQ